jgi:hypothetical protein
MATLTSNTTGSAVSSALLIDAEIKTLMTTGVTVVPAPGVGRVIVVEAVFMLIRKTAVYTNVNAAADVWLEYTGGGILTVGPGTTNGHLVFDTDTTPQVVEQTVNIAAEGALTNYENLPIQIKAANAAAGAFTAGDINNRLGVAVLYKIIPLPA